MESLPEARVERRRWSLAWVVPLLALLVVVAIGYDAIRSQGPEISIRFSDGHGIEPGDAIVHRGVLVGEVVEVGLAEDLRHAQVRARLIPDAAGLAVEGTRFWIVRPEVSLRGVRGVEALLGPNYIALSPGDGPPRQQFRGVEDAPVEPSPSAGALVVILEAERLGAIQVGSRVFYRDVPVGSVLAMRLSEDARKAEVTVEIDQEHRHLVRDNTRFWNASGFGLDLGFTGLSVKADSLESIVGGGVGFATPSRPGDLIESGRRFRLYSEVDGDWLDWDPSLPPPAPDESGSDAPNG
jgi:paraquat-inducible protein B